ncbi:hypothetical protein E4T50_08547 [Aureobasidium sp. EXF-12298]|nr:hypothetical protein E4T50_08547 [Aureobasidium sp. EXF-12298]KAI4761325.1 hypothetical protein E4T51_05682 [Aureobasidium sp. EXF-12344]KAI4777327.1 hypothetical protein E4T52_07740 [Aureobasidium sp. EXF-3400]
MPWRNSDAYGSQPYAAFTDPNGFNFTFDVGSDNFMSPYAFPHMSPDSAWTPTSQQFATSNQSDSLSPLEINNFTSPTQDQDLQYAPSTNASVHSDGSSIPAFSIRHSYPDQQKPSAQMIDSSNLSHGQKRSSSFLDFEAPQVPAEPVGDQPTSSTSSPAVPIKSRQSSSAGSPEEASQPSDAAAARVRTTDSAKVRHNIVERRYRENINAQVDVLRDSIVATVHSKEEQQGGSASRLGADELKRLTKAAVIAAATKQIRRARTENERLLDEHRALQAQIRELESLVKCGDCPLMKLTVDLSLESPTQPP